MIEISFSLKFGHTPRPPHTKPVVSLEDLEAAKQNYETFLTDLEALAVKALITGSWDAVYGHIATIAGNNANRTENYNAQAIALITKILSDRN